MPYCRYCNKSSPSGMREDGAYCNAKDRDYNARTWRKCEHYETYEDEELGDLLGENVYKPREKKVRNFEQQKLL